MAAKLFALCGFFGTVVLYPISRMGGDLLNSTDPNNNNTDSNSTIFHLYLDDPSTAPPPAPTSNSFLWIYLFFTYFFCLATFYFTFLNYRDYVRIRQEFMLRIGKSIPSRTVLVTGIPPSLRSDKRLADYFEKLGVGVVDSVHLIRHVDRLMDFIRERAKYLRQLETAYTRFWGNPCNDPTYDPDSLLCEAEQDQCLNALNWSTTSSVNNNSKALKQPQHQTAGTSYEHRDEHLQVDGYNDDDATQPLLPVHQRKNKKPSLLAKLKNKAKDPIRPLAKDGYLGMVGKHVDAIEYFTEKFNEMDTMVIKARKHGKFLPTSVGFVTFEDAMSAVSNTNRDDPSSFLIPFSSLYLVYCLSSADRCNTLPLEGSDGARTSRCTLGKHCHAWKGTVDSQGADVWCAPLASLFLGDPHLLLLGPDQRKLTAVLFPLVDGFGFQKQNLATDHPIFLAYPRCRHLYGNLAYGLEW